MKLLVLYGDGGAYPNNGNGYAGSGVHGYIAEDTVPKSGLGNKHHATDLGYFKKESIPKTAKQVTVLKYIDLIVGFKRATTNNVGELTAFIMALETALSAYQTDGIVKLVFNSDSRYVIDNFEQNLEKWIANRYRKSTGDEISNKDQWMEIKRLSDELKSFGVELVMRKVATHTGDFGNERADKYATLGQGLSRYLHMGLLKDLNLEGLIEMEGLVYQAIESDAKGYWNEASEMEHLLKVNQIYFVSDPNRLVEGVYYFSNNGKSSSNELRGKPVGDSCYGVTKLHTPDAYLESVKQLHCKILGDNTDLVEIKTALLQTPEHRQIHNLFGNSALRLMNRGGYSLQNACGDLTCEVLDKPYLGWYIYDNLENLAVLLDSYLNHTEEFTITDLTDRFYTTDKKGKIKLQDEFKSSFKSLQLEINTPKSGKQKVIFTANINIPVRNALGRLVEDNPKLKVISFNTSERVINYAFVIETDKGVSMWCSIDTNKIYI